MLPTQGNVAVQSARCPALRRLRAVALRPAHHRSPPDRGCTTCRHRRRPPSLTAWHLSRPGVNSPTPVGCCCPRSRRQPATGLHFCRAGGACPLRNGYEAFTAPGRTQVQVAEMPDGQRYLWTSRAITRHQDGWSEPGCKTFAISLGCDIRQAGRLVHADGLDLAGTAAATPIGMGCRICERLECRSGPCHRSAAPAPSTSGAARACRTPSSRRTVVPRAGHSRTVRASRHTPCAPLQFVLAATSATASGLLQPRRPAAARASLTSRTTRFASSGLFTTSVQFMSMTRTSLAE